MKKTSWIVLSIIVLAGVWYFFRPELVWIDTFIEERPPEVSAKPLFQGEFRSVAHQTTGMATVLRLPNRQRVLRLSSFETSNGPDVYICMVAAPDVTDSNSVREAGFVCLDPMKANIGSQNYEIPEDLDLDRYRAVSIWCRRFGVNFGTAPLLPYSDDETLYRARTKSSV